MRFVKLTNTGRYRDDPIYINVDQITSVFEEATDRGSLITVVFGGPGPQPIKWIVEESLGEVMKRIKELDQ